MTMDKSSVVDISKKQKINTMSLAEVEMVGADDILPCAIWTNLFIQAQGYTTMALLYKGKQTERKLETNGKTSSDWTRHLNIFHSFIKASGGPGFVGGLIFPNRRHE